jgi:hypothetical protein
LKFCLPSRDAVTKLVIKGRDSEFHSFATTLQSSPLPIDLEPEQQRQTMTSPQMQMGSDPSAKMTMMTSKESADHPESASSVQQSVLPFQNHALPADPRRAITTATDGGAELCDGRGRRELGRIAGASRPSIAQQSGAVDHDKRNLAPRGAADSEPGRAVVRR